MDDKRSPAERRSEALKSNLIVRTNTAGEPQWLATWRDARGKNVMRKVGPAWLVKINVFIAKHDAENRAKPASGSWRSTWVERGTRAEKDKAAKLASGALDYGQATMRARELIVAREQERDDLHDKLARAGDPRSFAALADEWISARRSDVRDGSLRPSTLADYEGVLRRPSTAQGDRREPRAWVMREFGDRKPREITGSEIDKFLAKLGDEHGLSERTRHKIGTIMNMVFGHAVTEGWITRNPTLDRKRAKRRARHRKAVTIYTMQQVEAIAREAGEQDGQIIRVAAMTGLRQGELLALKWGDIDWNGGQIIVRFSWDHRAGAEGPPKSGQTRTVPLADDAARVLECCSRTSEKTGAMDLIFSGDKGDHLDASVLRKHYCAARDAAIEKDAEIPSLRFHDLRHTFGSLLASGGIPIVAIQSYMGHADIQTTSIYLHHVSRTGAAAEVTRALRTGSTTEVVTIAEPVAS
jgi:integrase